MSDRYNKYRWLELAFTEQVDRLNESYYFDRRDNEFFSVFITDFFLTDPTSTDTYSDNPYSKTELEILAERINRLEQKDNSILNVPRLTIDERKQMMEKFLENNDRSSNHSELQKIIDVENGRTNLDFDNLLQDESQEEWRYFKRDFIAQKIDTFCNLQNINLDTACLWADKKMTTIIFNLEDTKQEAPKQTKPWWKFW